MNGGKVSTVVPSAAVKLEFSSFHHGKPGRIGMCLEDSVAML